MFTVKHFELGSMRTLILACSLVLLSAGPALAAISSVGVVNESTDCVRITLYSAFALGAPAFRVGNPRFVRAGEKATFSALRRGAPAASIAVRAEPMAKADCTGVGLGLTQTEYVAHGPKPVQPVAHIVNVGMRFLVRF